MNNDKFNDIKFNFPDDPNDFVFLKLLKETVKRSDFKQVKAEYLIKEDLLKFKATKKILSESTKELSMVYIQQIADFPVSRFNEVIKYNSGQGINIKSSFTSRVVSASGNVFKKGNNIGMPKNELFDIGIASYA